VDFQQGPIPDRQPEKKHARGNGHPQLYELEGRQSALKQEFGHGSGKTP
jgi:hypothetical protein